MKKVLLYIIFSIIIILILGLVIFTVREIIFTNDGFLNKKNAISREEFVNLLEKGAKYNNYYYYCTTLKDKDNKTEYYIKDNIVALYLDKKLASITDIENKTVKSYITTSDGKELIREYPITPTMQDQAGFDYSIALDNNDEYVYLGETTKDGRTLVIAKFVNSNHSKYKNAYTKFYVDKDTGLITKRVDIGKNFIFSEYREVSDRHIKLDIVTDKDIGK